VPAKVNGCIWQYLIVIIFAWWDWWSMQSESILFFAATEAEQKILQLALVNTDKYPNSD